MWESVHISPAKKKWSKGGVVAEEEEEEELDRGRGKKEVAL